MAQRCVQRRATQRCSGDVSSFWPLGEGSLTDVGDPFSTDSQSHTTAFNEFPSGNMFPIPLVETPRSTSKLIVAQLTRGKQMVAAQARPAVLPLTTADNPDSRSILGSFRYKRPVSEGTVPERSVRPSFHPSEGVKPLNIRGAPRPMACLRTDPWRVAQTHGVSHRSMACRIDPWRVA